jgi:hypothetical protein
MQVSAAYVASSKTTAEPSFEEAKSMRRGAFMVAAGAGLIVAGVLFPVLVNARRCPNGSPVREASIPGGVAVGFGGLMLSAIGSVKLRRRPAGAHLKHGEMGRLVLASVGTALVASGFLAAISASQIAGCIE